MKKIAVILFLTFAFAVALSGECAASSLDGTWEVHNDRGQVIGVNVITSTENNKVRIPHSSGQSTMGAVESSAQATYLRVAAWDHAVGTCTAASGNDCSILHFSGGIRSWTGAVWYRK